MIISSTILSLRTASRDYKKTEQLKAELAQLRRERVPFFLTVAEFDGIAKWKLRGQYARVRALLAANTDDIVRAVTRLALGIEHPKKDYEVELRIGILCVLRGVNVPVASAVLALSFPDEYALIDFRGWRQVCDEERTSFTVGQYKKYLGRIRQLSKELGWAPQEVDLAIWEYDMRHDESSKPSRPIVQHDRS